MEVAGLLEVGRGDALDVVICTSLLLCLVLLAVDIAQLLWMAMGAGVRVCVRAR